MWTESLQTAARRTPVRASVQALSAGLLAAGVAAFEHQGSEAGAGGVDRGGQAGAAGAEDKDVFSHGYVPS